MEVAGHSGYYGHGAMYKKLLSILALSILVAATLVGCESSPSTLTILSITEGDVFVMKAGTDDWIAGAVEMSLEVGDALKTGDDSGAEITFFDGSTMELEAGTQIEITSLDISADTGATTITLMQTIGTTISRVTKLLDPASRYEVETPTGVVAVRGSGVEIHVSEDGATWGCNLEGGIWFAAEGVELEVPEGRCCIIRPGYPPELAWKLAISSTSGGEVTTPGEGTFAYEEGTVVNLEAEPDEGYHFVNWSDDVDTISNVNAASTTITMNDNYSVRASFEEEAYTLTMGASVGGSTTPADGEHTYSGGTEVPISADPAHGYVFYHWVGDVATIADVNAASTTITMNGDYSIEARFRAIAPLQYSLTISSGAGGSVTSPGEGTFSYDQGTVVHLVATPDDYDYYFVNWTGNVGTIANANAASTTITMNGDYSITANFALIFN
ncbi:FecR domain-containing protein [Chloroflexota bacterium]